MNPSEDCDSLCGRLPCYGSNIAHRVQIKGLVYFRRDETSKTSAECIECWADQFGYGDFLTTILSLDLRIIAQPGHPLLLGPRGIWSTNELNNEWRLVADIGLEKKGGNAVVRSK
jgi:hypothetical protein